MFHANNYEVIRDDTSFSLSADQREIFAGWKRPVEIMPEVQDGNPELPLATFMSADGECDLAQDLATDCSVVASLAAAMRHLSPQKSSVGTNVQRIMYVELMKISRSFPVSCIPSTQKP